MRQTFVETQKGPSLRYEITCKECGKAFLVIPARRDAQYCGNSCRGRGQMRSRPLDAVVARGRKCSATKNRAVDERIEQATGMPIRDALVHLHHDSQLTLLAMSRELGLSRGAIMYAMQRHGVEQRPYDQSTHMKQWYMARPGAGRKLTERAHAAVRGRSRPHETLVSRAKTVQAQRKLSRLEQFVLQEFHDAGLHPIPLLALERYNIDFAFPDKKVAVEVHGGNWHASAKKRLQDAAKREFLLSRGWSLITFWAEKTKYNSKAMARYMRELVSTVSAALAADRPVELTLPRPTLGSSQSGDPR